MSRSTVLKRSGMLVLATSVLLAACQGGRAPVATTGLTNGERRAIADTIVRLVKSAYDLSKPGAEERSIALYPDTGRVISASAGHIITSRDSLVTGIRYFWQNVEINMRQPRWIWDQMLIDVLSPTAVAMTATYHIPHLTPQNQPHVIGGAWTAVFQKRGARWVIIQEHLSDLPPIMADTAHAQMNMDMTGKPPT